MTTQHTPGPWSTDLPEHEEPYQDIRIQAGTRGICRVWMDDAPVHDYNAEQLANARLIAAAPELLEALKAFDELIAFQYTGSRDAMSALQAAAFKAHDAITKATGGAA